MHQLMHESRTFIAKGIVSQQFFDLVHKVIHSVPTAYTVMAQVYNFIYRQVFTFIWKPHCDKVIAYEQSIGISTKNKRQKCRPRQRPSCTNAPSIIQRSSDKPPKSSWVSWFTASLRQGVTWISYVYSTQANMFGSFTSSALNSFTNVIDPKFNVAHSIINNRNVDDPSSSSNFSFFSFSSSV